ncbi:MAG: gluconate 2-dehydrogenase subunit 3 family protein [Burkholderia gladioli]|uniref:gluconate 2-dehydrogenase subunit 3 family protein n=1 Tax=Burkholderia gladioli TaxID=28095 RepID=UPI00163E252C|nr:gluconate 2-dehydrogenase subunit 3 family protein [Burkholderia gladioli]
MNPNSEKTDLPGPQAPSRRRFLVTTIAALPVAGGLGACGAHDGAASASSPGGGATEAGGEGAPYQPSFFKPAEWRCLQAAVDRLIPADAEGPGALELDVPVFIDRQMESGFGHAADWYMRGPFVHEVPALSGYQSPMTPREVYRTGLAALDAHCRAQFDGQDFAAQSHARQEALLHAMDAGTLKFDSTSAARFVGLLWQNTREGYFADPIHGGNKGAGSWKMIGFPGARADFTDWVDQPGKAYPLGTVTIAGT